MTKISRWLGAGLLAWLLAACGGGGDGPSGAENIPARAGAADIGPAGGSVSAVFEGGATITLTVPAGAVSATTTFRIDPATAPSDALHALSMSPAGLAFKNPATLSVTLPAGSDASGLIGAFDIEGLRVPIGAFDAATRTMTVDLRYLGTGAAEPDVTGQSAGRATAQSARSQPQGVVPHNTVVQMLLQRGDLVAALFAFHGFVDTLGKVGSRDNAVVVEETFGAVMALGINKAGPVDKAQVVADATAWGNVVCAQLTFAVSTINTAASSQLIRPYEQAVKDVIAWGLLMQEFNNLVGQLNFPVSVACPALQPDIAAPIRSTFATFLGATSLALARLSPLSDFDQLLTARVPELLSLDANLRLVGTVDDLAAQIEPSIVDQFNRLRQGAYDDCRLNQRQLLQRDLLARIVSDRSFDALRPYGETDLFSDIEFCGMAIGWELQDAQGVVLQSGIVGGGAAAGTVTPTASLDMTGADTLVIKGPLSALMCPGSAAGATTTVSPHSNNEQLGFDAGPLGGVLTSVGVLTPANDSHYLAVSSLPLKVSQLKALAQPTGSGNGELIIQRQRDTCFGEFPNFSQHRRLVRLELDFAQVRVATTALPAATVNVGYSATLSASGGTAPYTWSEAGLGAGLSLNTRTGVISGTPTSVGTLSVTFTATSAEGLQGTRTLSLTIANAVAVADVSGIYQGIFIDETPGSTLGQQFPADPVTVTQSGARLFLNGGIGGGVADIDSTGQLTLVGFDDGSGAVAPPPAGMAFNGSIIGRHLHWDTSFPSVPSADHFVYELDRQ